MHVPAIWTMMLLKLSAVKKFVALKLKKTVISTRPRTIGRTPRLPVLRCRRPLPDARLRLRLVSLGKPDARCRDIGLGAHVASSGTFSGTPATFVGIPAVMACTTSCWVVLSRS